MSAPFFDKSGTATVFPGDKVIITLPDGKKQMALLQRVWMQAIEPSGFEPFGEIRYNGVINAMPTAKMTKCVRYMAVEYASVAALDPSDRPIPEHYALVWSIKLNKFIRAIIKALDGDKCLISYKGADYEAPTNDVYIEVRRRK